MTQEGRSKIRIDASLVSFEILYESCDLTEVQFFESK